jgi:Lrp/AsnC family transcriptional regulator, leucine-responsive regulatory protein
MKIRRDARGLDEIDQQILEVLQADCKMPMAKVGDLVGLSAPSVVERIRKLENEGFIRGYHAELDARRLGLDVTAFIGVSINHPRLIESFDQHLEALEGVLECHHVTGSHTLLLKVKTHNTASLQSLISKLRSIHGVERTETNVVLKTLAECSEIAVESAGDASATHRKAREVPLTARTGT